MFSAWTMAGNEGIVGFVPEKQVSLFGLKLRSAGYRHLTGRLDSDARYASTHSRADGKSEIVVRTQGLGSGLAVRVHAEPDRSRPLARVAHAFFVGPDYETGAAILREDLSGVGFALSTNLTKNANSITAAPARVAVYVAFDFDNDLELKHALIAQARLPHSPFDVADFSLKEAAPERDWKTKAKQKIRRVQKVVVIVGTQTFRAPGVRAEVQIAQEERVPYTAIRGRSDRECRRPDWIVGDVHEWTWDNLRRLLGGEGANVP